MKLSKKKESGYKRRFGALKRVWCKNVGVKSVKTGKKLIESLLILKFE